MADQQVNFVLKATNQASAELARVAADLTGLQKAAQSTRGDVVAWGNAWGTASASAAGGAKTAARGIGELDAAAKSFTHGALRELTGGVPILDSALSKLLGSLTGFPLAMSTIVGGGVALVKALSDISAEASKANLEIAALSKTMGSDLQQAILQINKIRAEGAGDKAGGAQFGADAEIKALEKARDDAIDAARKKLDQTPDPRGALIPVSLAERLIAEGKFAAESGKAEEDLALKKFAINQKLKFDLKGFDDERLATEKKNREEAVKIEADAAAKVKQFIEDVAATTTRAGDIFKGLGAGFEEMAGKLSLASYLQKARADIETLKGYQDLIAQGDDTLRQAGITAEGVGAAIKKLTDNMQDAVNRGAAPLAENAKAVATAIDGAGAAAARAAPSFAELADAMTAAAQAQTALASRPPGGGGPTPSIRGSGTIGNPDDLANKSAMLAGVQDAAARYKASQVLGEAFDTLNRYGRTSTQPYTYPESDPSRFTPSERSGTGGGGMGTAPPMRVYRDASGAYTNVRPETPGGNTTVNNFHIEQTGTVIQQERDWQTLVTTIGQSLQKAQ